METLGGTPRSHRRGAGSASELGVGPVNKAISRRATASLAAKGSRCVRMKLTWIGNRKASFWPCPEPSHPWEGAQETQREASGCDNIGGVTIRVFWFLSLSAVRVVSSAYLRLLIFLPAILIPACASSRPAFLMMYSAYELNKQGDSIQP